ncbi:Fc.00g093510.m01.CDS01 [Cosmosporella sp. VM-42]
MHCWHEESCSQPNIEVLPDGTPHCRSCDRAPDIAELVAKRATASSVPLVPSDKPRGQMNLWWPRSVPYMHSASTRSSDVDKLGNKSKASKQLAAVAETSPYSSTLQPRQFRLICLPAVADQDCPLHLTLEVYDLEDCPEYETASYTWAGEDGDAALCRPIYVGDFWDVLLQTRNCWEMLRFVRPWRGTRMLWVDAVCINQSNLSERNRQVANMGLIYSACTRVVVYLGPDIAVPLHGRHPRRRRLHELESGTIKPFFPPRPEDGDDYRRRDIPPHRLENILGRRYFSRVWVIQELLLSQRVVMRVGDVDFWADPAMSTYFSSSVAGWNWERSPAPWVQRTSQGASSVTNLRDLLLLTSLSQATDPRDRVFGLLGIMPELSDLKWPPFDEPNAPPMPQGGLQVDYSLSCQHVFVGLFAYCLINMRQANILYHASCLHSNVSNYPSWVPRVTQTTFRLLFSSPKINSQDVFTEVQSIIDHNLPRDEFLSRDVLYSKLYELRGPGQPHITAERSWYHAAHIDTMSGALAINLTQYISISQPLRKIGKISGFSVFAMRAGTIFVYLLSEQPLDTIITGLGNEQLFVLNINDHSIMYLMLRPTSNLGDGKFNLISTCPFALIEMPSAKSENEIPTLRALSLKDLQNSLFDVVEEVDQLLDEDLHPPWWSRDETQGIFPGIRTYREMLPAVFSFFVEEREGSEKLGKTFAEAYIGCIDPRYSPRIGSEYVKITISSYWAEIWDVYIQETGWLDRHIFPAENPPWEYRIKGGHNWANAAVSSSTYKKLKESGSEQWIDVRFPVDLVRKALANQREARASWIFRALDRLEYTCKQTGRDLWLMLTQPPNLEDRFIGCPSERSGIGYARFLDLWEELGISGSTSLISIE